MLDEEVPELNWLERERMAIDMGEWPDVIGVTGESPNFSLSDWKMKLKQWATE